MAGDVPAPLRVGLLPVVGRFGRHLIERFAFGVSFRVVAAVDSTTQAMDSLAATNLVAPFDVRLVRTPQELVQAEDIDVLWWTSYGGFRPELAAIGVNHRKHTIVETPLALTNTKAAEELRSATQQGRLLLVHHPRRADLDFRRALTVAQDPAMGAIRSAKFVSWSYGLSPRGASGANARLSSDACDDLHVTKTRFVAHALDQLLSLIGDRPVSVFATGDLNACDATDLMAGYSLALSIVFETGSLAEVDVRLDSPASFQSGWTLTGERGGYANGRKFTLTEDGEVFDSPVIPSGSDADSDQFEWLAQQIRCGVPDVAEEARVRTVVSILDAAQRSLATRQVASV